MAALLDRQQLLAHLRGDDERMVGARIADAAEAALKNGEPVVTNFLDPRQQEVCLGLLGSIPEISYKAFGGYQAAERKCYAIFPQYYLTELVAVPIGALEIVPESRFDQPGHRDYLGAMSGLGVERDAIGDIVLTTNGAQAIVMLKLIPFFIDHLRHVGSSPVRVAEIDLERLDVEPQRVKEIKTTVASMRLDAVAGSGFSTSRTKMVREIKAERVKLNWQVVTNPAKEVAVGDVISMRGRGRVVVRDVLGSTRKGRHSLVLVRYS